MRTKKEIQQIRDTIPGFIGGEIIAKFATDEEIDLIVDLENEYTKNMNLANDLKIIVKRIQKTVKLAANVHKACKIARQLKNKTNE